MKEVWKPVVGYEGLYEVSSEGRVKSLARQVKASRGNGMRGVPEKLLNHVVGTHGYVDVGLWKGNKVKQKRVHILVAEAFIENTFDKPYVNHVNEDKADNRVSNLEWVTAKENTNHGTCIERSRYTNSTSVKGTHEDSGKEVIFMSAMEAERNGFKSRLIYDCCNGKRNIHLKYRWEKITKEEYKKALEK